MCSSCPDIHGRHLCQSLHSNQPPLPQAWADAGFAQIYCSVKEMSWSARELFEVCLEQPAHLRIPYLKSVLAPGHPLLREVEGLLSAHENVPDRFLSNFPLACEGSEWAVGTRVGVYKVLSKLGSGGAGLVYEVERADGVFRKRFALKVLRQGILSPSSYAAFQAERQILARLDHPNICGIVDGGTSPEGWPYLVMNLVKGLPVTDFAKARHLHLHDRLALLLRILRAAAYLHGAGLTHGDIKPANILVDETGEPRLLDFGIARFSGAPGAVTEELYFTPLYAAPEQFLKQCATEASDVYALGVIAYELLTECHPFQAAADSRDVAILKKAVTEQQAPAPSQALPGKVWKSMLRGDLDAILRRALSKTPAQRYRTAAEFAGDIENFLQHRPVHARRATIPYRVRKFLRRRRSRVAAAALLLVSLVYAGLLAWENDRLRKIEASIRYRAESTFLQSSADGFSALTAAQITEMETLVREYSHAIANSLVARPGMTSERRQLVQLLDQYLVRMEPLLKGNSDQLSVMASVYYTLGNLRGYPHEPNLGDPGGAAASYERCLQLLRSSPKISPRAQALIAQAESRLAVVQSVHQRN